MYLRISTNHAGRHGAGSHENTLCIAIENILDYRHGIGNIKFAATIFNHSRFIVGHGVADDKLVPSVAVKIGGR